ncbi:MAG: hypothetical protein AAF720_11130 [Pseudomonadota bacterium]
MLRKFVERLALPSVIAIIAAGAALATVGEPLDSDSPVAVTQSFDAEQIRTHAEKVFRQADLNSDGDLNVDEFATLSVVIAELSRLNGYVSILNDGEGAIAPIQKQPLLTKGDRIFIEALSAKERALAAGLDNRLDVNEFIDFELNRFLVADFNRNGILKNAEVIAYANQAARIQRPQS